MPKRGAVESWSSGDLKRYLSSMGLDAAAEKLLAEGIDGKAALALSSSDLKEAGIYLVPERKKTEAALMDLRHPLMAAFVSVDTNCDFRVDAEEISHVMSNVNGAFVAEAKVKAMLADADLDGDGDLDFSEFKEVMESETLPAHWSRAGQELSLAEKCLAAGDEALKSLHAAMRAGAKISGSRPESAPPRRIPSLTYRLFANWAGLVVCSLVDCFTFGLFFSFGLVYLSPRGQYRSQWLFGLQCVDVETGAPATAYQLSHPLLLEAGIGGFALFKIVSVLFWAAMRDGMEVAALLAALFTPCMALCGYFFFNIASAFFDLEGRLLTDKAAGIVVVFKETRLV
jgi:hypothetical protein